MNAVATIAWGLAGICLLVAAALWLSSGQRDYARATRGDGDEYADCAIHIADQAHDQDFHLWTDEFWNDMNQKEETDR